MAVHTAAPAGAPTRKRRIASCLVAIPERVSCEPRSAAQIAPAEVETRMATLRTQVQNPGARRTVGQSVLSAARVLDTKKVKVRLAAFAKAHAAYVKAADKVVAAEAVRDAAHAAVAAQDVAQDVAVDALVLALVGAGAPRLSPLKGLSNVAPADLKKLGTQKEAKATPPPTNQFALSCAPAIRLKFKAPVYLLLGTNTANSGIMENPASLLLTLNLLFWA